VDTDALVARLQELGVTAYYWRIRHVSTDWDDLKLFLPKARAAGIMMLCRTTNAPSQQQAQAVALF
jgi:hypothetical protein